MTRIFGFFSLLLLTFTALAGEPSVLRIRHFDNLDGFSQTHVSVVIQDRQGFIWLAAIDGLWCYDGTTFRNYKATPGDGCPLETNRLTSISETKDGNILCKSSGQFYLFDRRTQTFSKTSPTTMPRGYNGTREERAAVAALPEFAGIKFNILCRDNQRGLWVESHRGLERLERMDAPVAPQKVNAAASEEFVRTLYIDKQARRWVADKNGYVRLIDRSGLTRYLSATGALSPVPTVFGHSVYCMLEDSRGTFWLGTKPDGLFCLTPSGGGFAVKRYMQTSADKYSLNDNHIYGLAEDRYGHLLVATYGGGLNVGQRQGDAMRFYNHGNSLSYPLAAIEAKSLAVTPSGYIIVGSTHGLVISQAQRDVQQMGFTIHHREPSRAASLCNDIINSVYVARSGTVFLATAGGVDQITSRKLTDVSLNFRHYSSREGLPSDICLSLVEDKQGNIWVVSEVALGCLNPRRGVSLNYMRNFFSGRFLFSEAPPLCLPSGELLIGTTQGLLAFHPDRVAKSTYVPRLTVDCDSVVHLTADDPNLDIRMAALDLNRHEHIVYAYRMEGTDDDWQFTESDELHFAALAPGTYKLHLKSTNGDGVWVDNERVLTIVRHASFAETPYAWMLLAVLLLAVGGVVYFVARYIRRLHKVIGELKMSGGDQLSIVGDQLREIFVSQEMPEEIAEEPASQLSASEQAFADQCQQFIMDNLSNENLDVPAFAREMGMSRTKLYAMVKKVYDTSPNNLILNVRIREAKRRLREPDVTVSEVAYAMGFSDPKYFSRCFKRLVGVSPSDYSHGS